SLVFLQSSGAPRHLHSFPTRRSSDLGTVTVRTPEFEAVHKELGERGILCDFRPDVGLRLGPHYYNTDDELRRTVAQIAEIVETEIGRASCRERGWMSGVAGVLMKKTQ